MTENTESSDKYPKNKEELVEAIAIALSSRYCVNYSRAEAWAFTTLVLDLTEFYYQGLSEKFSGDLSPLTTRMFLGVLEKDK